MGKLKLFDLVMIVVSLVIGMGIFRTPVTVAQAGATPFLIYGAWVAGGFIAICGALTYAEIGSRFPVSGAYFRIFSYAYHPSIAFAINCIILVSNAASLAGVALIGAEYLGALFFPDHQNAQVYKLVIASVAIFFFYGINLLGLRMSAYTQNVLTVIKIAMVLMLIGALIWAEPLTGAGNIWPSVEGTSSWWVQLKAFGVCLIAVSFTYGGYQQSINFGGEVAQPNRTLPRGIMLGIAIIMLLYLLINITYVYIIGLPALGNTESIAAVLAGQLFGYKGFALLSFLLFLSVLAYVNVLLMSNPRVMAAMSEDEVLPPWFSKKHPKTGVLVPALSVFAIICVFTLFYAGTFEKILNYTIFLDSIGMATSAATIFLLRKRKVGDQPSNQPAIQPADQSADQPAIQHQSLAVNSSSTAVRSVGYRMKWYPLMPLIFIAAYLFVAVSIFLEDAFAALNGLVIFGIFLLIYYFTVHLPKQNRNRKKQEPMV